jgi:hypothetical protein
MAAYNPYAPTPPASSDPFSATDIQDSFEELSRWSINVGDYASGAVNIRNDREISARSFRPGSLTKVWKTGNLEPDSYVVFLPGNGSTAAVPWSVVTSATGAYDYDVPGASLNIYLREAVPSGGLHIRSTVHFWKARESSYYDPVNEVTAATFLFKLTGYLDGSPSYLTPTTNEAETQYTYTAPGGTPGPVGFSRRGFNLTWTGTNIASVAAGLRRFKLRLEPSATCTFTSTNSANSFLYNHIKGSGARTTITAIYK